MIIVFRLVMLNDSVIASYGEDEPLAVAFKAVVHKEVEHCVGVDGQEACTTRILYL